MVETDAGHPDDDRELIGEVRQCAEDHRADDADQPADGKLAERAVGDAGHQSGTEQEADECSEQADDQPHRHIAAEAQQRSDHDGDDAYHDGVHDGLPLFRVSRMHSRTERRAGWFRSALVGKR